MVHLTALTRCGTARSPSTEATSSAGCPCCSACSAGRSQRTHAAAAGPTGPAHPAVGQAMRMLEGRLAHRWTLTELADQLHLAPGYLVRLFKSATGLPPMAYLARLRAEHAAALLLHSDEPVTCIGRAVGWPDQNYFARRFKAHYGLSATTYRAQFASGASHLRSEAGRPRSGDEARAG